MLEMLGVLAIMGIITYGAIAGINYGMSSYKINQTYSEVQDIVQGVEDLYSWTKGYPVGTVASGDYAGCKKIIAAACLNDVLQDCTDNTAASDKCTGKGVFGTIDIDPINGGDNFKVNVTIADEDERRRVSEMDWAAVNIDYDCTKGNVCEFSPKSN